MKYHCPRCGTEARVLLNLVGCLTPQCRNYEPKWADEWNSRNKPTYRHHESSHKFLGSFNVRASTSSIDQIFDLYYALVNQQVFCLARYSDLMGDCYFIDDKQTQLGKVDGTAVVSITEAAKAALKEALGRSGKKA